MNALYAPRYWPTWLGLGAIRLLALLPFPVMRVTGKLIGNIAYYLLGKRRHIAEVNLKICFPEKDTDWHRHTLKRHFQALGMALLEIPVAWWGSEKKLRKLTKITGLEHLQRAQAEGKGVILLAAHFTSLEITGRCLLTEAKLSAMYRRSDNPVMERVISRQRGKWMEKIFARDAVKDVVRTLRAGNTVWYAADQNTSRKQSVFVKFFGEWASTNSATARLSKMTGARVVPFKGIRSTDGSGYEITLEPALENYPTGELEADTQRINDLIQRWVTEYPEQYLWIHRRFRTRPVKGDASPYQ